MQFNREMRELVVNGEVTASVRVWKRPRVKVGGRYRVVEGHILVDRVSEIGFADITPRLARETGFASVGELLQVARHGEGERVFLVEFRYFDGPVAKAQD